MDVDGLHAISLISWLSPCVFLIFLFSMPHQAPEGRGSSVDCIDGALACPFLHSMPTLLGLQTALSGPACPSRAVVMRSFLQTSSWLMGLLVCSGRLVFTLFSRMGLVRPKLW